MSVLVIGATGYIGRHICNQLDQKLIPYRVLSRNPEKAGKLLKARDIVQGDLSHFEEMDLINLFDGINEVIFAAGVDERSDIVGNAEDFFFYYNVTQCLQVLRQAKAHGIKRAVVLGSIFTYFDDINPDIGLSNHHIYIASRRQQKECSLDLTDKTFSVTVAEIPLVLGALENNQSPITGLIDYCRYSRSVFCTEGGINAISVHTLSKAIVNLTLLDHAPTSLPIADQNLSWQTIIEIILKELGKTRTKVHVIKASFFNKLTRAGGYFQQLFGVQTGLNQRYVGDIVNNQFFIDADEIKHKLDYQGGDVEKALVQTVQSHCRGSVTTTLSYKFNQIKSQLDSLKKRSVNF